MNDRRRSLEVRPDGTRWDHAVMRMWLDQQDARAPKPVIVRRLSESMPELQMKGRR